MRVISEPPAQMRKRMRISKEMRARLLREIQGDDSVAQVEAAKRCASDASVSPELRSLLRHTSRASVRQAIAFALSWQDDPRNWASLVRLVANTSDSPSVRAQAAEGLAYHFHRKRRGSSGFRAGLRALAQPLADRSAEVRYYACFALGESRDPAALPALRKLATDPARSTAFVGSVGEEARKAIDLITLRKRPVDRRIR